MGTNSESASPEKQPLLVQASGDEEDGGRRFNGVALNPGQENTTDVEPEAETMNSHRRAKSDAAVVTFQKGTSEGGGNERGVGGRRGNFHRRHRTSLSNLMAGLGESTSKLGAIVEEVAQDASHSLKRELKAADSGRLALLDTGLIRGFSVLPEDLGELIEEVPLLHAPDENNQPATKNLFGPFIALLSAVIAISSNGTALALQHGVPPALKLYWRMTSVALTLSGLVIKSMYQNGGIQIHDMTASHVTSLGLAILCFSIQTLCFFVSLDYTTIGNAVIFANSQALILLVGKFLMGHSVLCIEGVGALVAFGGALICACTEQKDHSHVDIHTDDSSTSMEDIAAEMQRRAIIGDVLAMCSALVGVGYLTFAAAVRPHVAVTTFMFLIMSCGSILVLGFLLLSGTPITFNNDPFTGMFGWTSLRWDRLGVEVWIVFVCNLVGTMGLVRGMAYFDSIIIAVATLLEPMIASIIAYCLHVGVLPDGLGWVGNALVIIGTVGVVYPSASKGEGGGGH